MCMSVTNQAREVWSRTARRGAHDQRLRSIYFSRSCNLKRIEPRILTAPNAPSATSRFRVRVDTEKKLAASSGVIRRTGL